MRGLVLPDLKEDFTADPVELFFDLAFVFAFSRLVAHLVHHPDWTGAGEALLLFGLIWYAWSWFSWSANAVSGNSRRVRLVFLVATAVTVPMAASVETAFGSGGSTFAVAAAVIMLMAGVLSLVTHERGSTFFESLARLFGPNVLAMAIMVVGGFVDGSARVVLWVIAVVIMFGGTAAAGRGDFVVRFGHFSERHGLILIIALGEVIVAIGISVANGLDDGGLDGATRLGLMAAGIFAGLMWWSYFDRVLSALEHRGEELDTPQRRGQYARNVYTWAHGPIIAGVITAAAAAEEILLHPSDPLHGEFRVMMAVGLGLFFGGIALAVYLAFRVVAIERLAGLAAIVLLCLISGGWDGVWLLVAIDLALVVTLVAEHLRIEGPHSTE